LELELWLLLPLLRWNQPWPLPPLPEPLDAWSRPMVLSYVDAKLVYLFYIVEPVVTTSLVDPTGTPIGSEILGANEGLEVVVMVSPLLDIT